MPGRELPAVRFAVIAGLAGTVGCADLTDAERFDTAPDRLEIVSTIPAHDATEVDPDIQIDLCFSAAVDPRSVDDFDAVLSSGVVTFDTETSVQLFGWRPPGQKLGLADEAWCPGSVLSVGPRGPLRRGSTYRVRLRPTPVGWAGEALDLEDARWVEESDGERFYTLEFTVPADQEDGGDGGDGGDGAPDAPTLTELFAPGEVFDPGRDACGCHTSGGREEALAIERLDLSTVDVAFQQLVEDKRIGATGFLLVAERNPSSSYLIQKLMRDEDGAPLHAVLGDAMPRDEPLPHLDMAKIAEWIAGGASK